MNVLEDDNTKTARRIWSGVGIALLLPLLEPHLKADIITQIGGDTRNFVILYTGGGGKALTQSQGNITGNIGVGGTGSVKLTGSGVIDGNIDFSAPNTGQFSITPSKTLNGSVNYSQPDVATDLTDIASFSSAVDAEPGFNLGAINLSSGQGLTVNASAGVPDGQGNRVFTISSFTAAAGSTITINGDLAGDNVILNLDTHGATATLDGNVILNGITADQVFFNITGGGELKIDGGSVQSVEGVFADTNGQIFVSGATIGGRLFGGDGKNMEIVSNATIDSRTPEPSAVVLAATVLLGFGLAYKRGWFRRRPA
ncbi:MAG TPA: hypothetical protein VKV74_15345 [Bryobacteraceae bacterium]|nr:hypothetical protein [Bryobacteraceae bacterium]